MEITYDAIKNEKNIRERGLSFNRARELDWPNARIESVIRGGEVRFVAKATLAGRVHVICYTRTATRMRVISFRKANKREVKQYEESQS